MLGSSTLLRVVLFEVAALAQTTGVSHSVGVLAVAGFVLAAVDVVAVVAHALGVVLLRCVGTSGDNSLLVNLLRGLWVCQGCLPNWCLVAILQRSTSDISLSNGSR